MFHEPGNRLLFPFALQNLQCKVDGRSIPLTAPSLKRQHNSQQEPRLHAIANHLQELTENPASLPVALARALAGEEAWEGLGLLSGSTIIDIIIVNSLRVAAFCQRYGPEGWSALLRQELPALTGEDITWLSDLSEEMEQFEPRTPITVMDIWTLTSRTWKGQLGVRRSDAAPGLPTGMQGHTGSSRKLQRGPQLL